MPLLPLARGCFQTRSVGPRAAGTVRGKPRAAPASRTQDGVLKQPLRVASLAWLLLYQAAVLPQLEGAEREAFGTNLEPVFRQSCTKCHGEQGKVKGKVNLLAVKSASDLREDPELVGKLIEALELEEMPPRDETPLEPKLRRQMVKELKAILRASLSSGKTFARAASSNESLSVQQCRAGPLRAQGSGVSDTRAHDAGIR